MPVRLRGRLWMRQKAPPPRHTLFQEVVKQMLKHIPVHAWGGSVFTEKSLRQYQDLRLLVRKLDSASFINSSCHVIAEAVTSFLTEEEHTCVPPKTLSACCISYIPFQGQPHVRNERMSYFRGEYIWSVSNDLSGKICSVYEMLVQKMHFYLREGTWMAGYSVWRY